MRLKPVALTAFFLCCAAVLCMTVGAATFTDEMDSLVSDAVKQYSGLMQVSQTTDTPDKSMATFSGGFSFTGSAVYRVTGATGVQATIYSQNGTFIHPHHNETDKYMLGIYPGGNRNPTGMTQALYCPVSDAVYTKLGGLKQMHYEDAYVFSSVRTPPSSNLIGYGINFYFSYDGATFIRVEAKWQSVQFDTVKELYCFERYAASIPAAAKYIKVEINDISSVPTPNGEYIPNSAMPIRLASVVINGTGLVMGEPEAAVSIPSFQAAQSSVYYESEDAAEKIVIKAAEAADAESSQPAESAAKSSSKFEGTITSPSKSEKSAKKSAASSSEPASVKSASSQEPVAEERVEPSEQEIRIVRNDKPGMSKTAVTVYIIIATGAVVLLLLNKGK